MIAAALGAHDEPRRGRGSAHARPKRQVRHAPRTQALQVMRAQPWMASRPTSCQHPTCLLDLTQSRLDLRRGQQHPCFGPVLGRQPDSTSSSLPCRRMSNEPRASTRLPVTKQRAALAQAAAAHHDRHAREHVIPTGCARGSCSRDAACPPHCTAKLAQDTNPATQQPRGVCLFGASDAIGGKTLGVCKTYCGAVDPPIIEHASAGALPKGPALRGRSFEHRSTRDAVFDPPATTQRWPVRL